MSTESFNIRKELVDALNHSSLLQFVRDSSSDSTDLRRMLEDARVVSYKKGNVIIREGTRSERIFFLTAGKVEVSIEGKPICTLGRIGDVFGEMGVITGEVRSATVTALTEVKCLATGVTFAADLMDRGNLLFLRVLQDALSRILTGRLKSANVELAQVKQDLRETRDEMEVIKLENSAQLQEIESLRTRGRKGLFWPHRDEKGR